MIDKNLVGMDFVITETDGYFEIGRKYLDAKNRETGSGMCFMDPYKYTYSINENDVVELGERLDKGSNYYSEYLRWKSDVGIGLTSTEKDLINSSCPGVTVKHTEVVVEEKNIGMVKATIKDTRNEPTLIFPLIAKSLEKGSNPGEGEYTVLFRSDSNGTVISGNEERKIGDVLSWMCSQFSGSMNGCWEILPAGVQVILENK